MKAFNELALFAKGRNLRMVCVLAVAMMAICFRWWHVMTDTHVLNQVEPVWVGTSNVVPPLFAIAMICCCAPRVSLADRLGAGRQALYGTVTVAVVCMVAMLAMPVVYGVYTCIPREWIPDMDNVDLTGTLSFADLDLFASGVALMRALQAGFYGAVATALIALVGRLAGVALSLAVMAGELLLASLDPLGSTLTFTSTTDSAPVWCAVVSAMLVASWIVWYLTAAGAPLRSLWHGGKE